MDRRLAHSGELRHTPYYGFGLSTPLWIILLGITFDWTGDVLLGIAVRNAIVLPSVASIATATATRTASSMSADSDAC